MAHLGLGRAAAEHGELLATAGKLRRVISGAVAPETAHAILVEFESRIEEHRELEVRSLYEPLTAFAEQRSGEFAAMLTGMLAKAGTDWASYLKQWTPDRIEAHWSAFGEQTRRVLDRGRARLFLEDKLLYPLALRQGLISP